MNRLRAALSGIRRRLAGRTKVQASLFYASSSLICQAMRFCGIVISTRLIDARQFGYFAQASLVLVFAGLVREIGQTTAFVSYNGQDRRYAAYHFQLNAVLGLLAAILVWSLFPFLTAIPSHVRLTAGILAALALVENLTQTGLIAAQKAFRFGLLARIEIIAVAVWLGTLIGCVSRCEGFIALLIAQLAEFSFRLAAIMAASGWRCVGRATGGDLRSYYFGRFMRHLAPQTILQTIVGRLDYLLLTFLGTVTQLGIYERMLQFIRIPWSLSINLIDRVLLVSYSREQDDPSALRQTLRKSMLFIAVAVAAATLVATLAIVFVLPYLVGTEWAHTILGHWWVALPFTLLTPLVWNLNIFCQGTGQAAQLFRGTFCLLVATLVAGLLAVPQYGARGMLVAQAVAYAALLVFQGRAVSIMCGKRS
jgi:O-antigen/teichoic acid export membrane protein